MQMDNWRSLYAANRAAIAGYSFPPTVNRVSMLGDPAGSGAAPIDLSPLDRVLPGGDAEATVRPVVHRPDGLDPLAPAPLVVVLHGCTQTAAGLAAATRLNELADRFGFATAYPEQPARRNARRCWNWFEPAHQSRGRGEPAILAEAIGQLAADTRGQLIDRDRVFLVGFSAGAAMACVLAATYPDLFAGLAVHSGLAYRSATDLPSALQAMRRGATDPARLGRAVRASMGEGGRVLPTIVLHGTVDRTVHPINGDQVAAQWRHANGLAYAQEPTETERGRADRGHAYLRRRWLDSRSRPVLEQVTVDGLGHAWSGGAQAADYADPRGPHAGDMIWRFFTQAPATPG